MKMFIVSVAISLVCLILNVCEAQLQVIPVPNKIDEETNSTLTDKDLKTVFKMVKNVSRSKGDIIESEDGDVQFRRSFVKKVTLKAKFDILKSYILIAQQNDSDLLDALNDIEYLVHQFDVALDFIKIGGVELVLPLTRHQDSKVAAVAFSVMTAAMQGNPAVQEYAGKAGILDFITDAMTFNPKRALQSVLYTLSSYLRNMPKAQLYFYENNGLSVVADIIRAQNESLKAKLKIIDLLSDLATELNNSPESKISRKLLKLLRKGTQDYGLCDEIPSFLCFDEYFIHEKIVDAMNSLFPLCSDEFSPPYIIKLIIKLHNLYIPRSKHNFYSKLDPEMMWLLTENLEMLYEKIMAWKFKKKK